MLSSTNPLSTPEDLYIGTGSHGIVFMKPLSICDTGLGMDCFLDRNNLYRVASHRYSDVTSEIGKIVIFQTAKLSPLAKKFGG